MVIWFKFRMRQFRDGDHKEDVPHSMSNRQFVEKCYVDLI